MSDWHKDHEEDHARERLLEAEEKAWQTLRRGALRLVGEDVGEGVPGVGDASAKPPSSTEECKHDGPRKHTLECECGLELEVWWEA